MTWQEYQSLLPEVPYIGGEKNLNSGNLLASSYTLAVYRVLQARGQTTEEAGQIIYEAYEAASDLPGWLGGVVGRMRRGTEHQERWRAQAAESQKRRYPGDWVFTFVEGDGQEFDYGLDFTECGICKFYHAQGADELTPYLCLMDGVVIPIAALNTMNLSGSKSLMPLGLHVQRARETGCFCMKRASQLPVQNMVFGWAIGISRAFGLGLVRHKTLAEGADICDFRYRAGRETFLYPLRDGWPPKFLNEKA